VVYLTVAAQVIRDWMYRKNKDYWQSNPGQKHAKSFLLKLSAKRTQDFRTQQIPSKTSDRTLSLKGQTLQTGFK
jgi:hypothetical protein